MRTGALALLVCVIPATLTAQTPADSARVDGRVRSVLNGAPLAGVMIAFPDLQRFAVTDSTGTFTLTGLRAGEHVMRVKYAERVNEDYAIRLRAGQRLSVLLLLDVEAVTLAPVVVEGRAGTGDLGIAGFYERRRFGFGRFVTAEQLARDRSQPLGDYLARFGLHYGCVGMRCGPVRYSAGRPCVVPVMVDGAPGMGQELRTLQTHELGGIEVYRDESEMPGNFSLVLNVDASSSRNCGAVIVWTKVWELGGPIRPAPIR